MKKILYDLSFLTYNGYSGVAIYALRLLKGLMAYQDLKITLLAWDNRIEWIKEETGFEGEVIALNDSCRKYLKGGWSRIFKVKPSFYNQLNVYDVCLTPSMNTNSFIFPKCIKQIGVIHDLQHIQLAKKRRNVLLPFFHSCFYRYLYKRLDTIVAISQNTAKDVKTFCGVDSVVIYNSITQEGNGEVRPSTLPESISEYILDVNSYDRYKNADTLVRAFNSLKDKYPSLFLYFKGSKNNNDYLRIEKLSENLNVRDRIIIDTSRHSYEEMNYLYNHATLFVTPSLMEGFGFSPVESIIAKVPTIVSKIPTLIEVTQGLVPSFDPYSPTELSACIEKELLRASYDIDSASEQLKQLYSVSKQAQGFYECIVKLANCK